MYQHSIESDSILDIRQFNFASRNIDELFKFFKKLSTIKLMY